VTSGAIDLPSGVARVLPDGSTQFTQYAYNPLGNVTEFIDPIGRTTLHCYGPTPCNSTTNYVDLQLVDNTAGGIVWQAPSYNQQHEPLEVIPPGVYTSWQFQYNSVGQPQTVTDPYGNVTTYHYGTATGTPAASGYLLSWDSPAVTPPGSTDAGATQIATVSFTYDGYGRIASTTDPGGETIKRQYDNANRLALLTFPDLSTEQFQYINLDLWLTTDRVATNPPTLRTYDALRRVTQIQGPTGVTHIEYDPNGPIDGTVVVEDPNGNQTIYEHLFEGELSEISNQDGTSTIFAYDGMSSTPQAGGVGGVPRVVQVAKGVKSGVPFHQTFYTYNADDTLSSIQPQNPYSSAGVAPTMATNPLSTFFTWDPDFRRLTGWAQGNFFGLGVGAVSDESYTYNPFPQSPGSPSLEGGSTGAGLLNNVTDLWIPQGPESSEPSLNFVSYNYDSFGRVSERQVSTTFTPASVSFDESFTYDAIGRLSTDSNSLDTFTYNYSDGTSRPSSRTSADGGPQISYGYYGPTNDNLLKQATYTTLANSQIAAFSYAFDDDHEMTQFGETYAGGRTNQTTYEYKNGALAGTIPTSVSQPGLTTNYIQDPAGNPTFIQGASTLAPGAIVNMTSNDMNEIASLNEVASGGVTTLPSPSYDPDGNLLTAELGSPATYSYDAYDRLQSITYMTTDEKLQFFYDGVGRLSEIVDTVGEQVLQDHTYFWCGDERCFERDQTELDSYGAAPVVDKVYFSQGKLYGFGAGLSPAYYVTDALGSVREEMAASTSEVSSLGQFEYDPYGNDTPVQGVGYTNGLHDIGFAGYFEPGTLPGLAFARNRVYAPGIGRWLTRDPIGNGRAFWDLRHFNSVDVDLYAYARNNPSSYIDPSGNDLATALAGLAGGALVGGVSAYLADAPAGEIFAGAVAGGAGGFVVGFIDPAALGGTFAGIGIGVAGAALAGGGWGSIVTNGIAGGVAGGISGAFGGLPGVAVTSMLALPLGITASVVGDAIDDAQKEATGEDTENGTCHQ
jgi:RHS repeat-associated protein